MSNNLEQKIVKEVVLKSICKFYIFKISAQPCKPKLIN